jgi:general secretion pathway protein G
MKRNYKNAFTMIELIFVIVVLGILASIAIPKFAVTRNDAILAKGKTDVATIRSAIVSERQSQIIKGNNVTPWIPKLSNDTGNLFTGRSDLNRTLLMYGIAPGEWAKTNDTTYTFTTAGTTTTFTYSNVNGTFTCAGGDCSKLTD